MSLVSSCMFFFTSLVHGCKAKSSVARRYEASWILVDRLYQAHVNQVLWVPSTPQEFLRNARRMQQVGPQEEGPHGGWKRCRCEPWLAQGQPTDMWPLRSTYLGGDFIFFVFTPTWGNDPFLLINCLSIAERILACVTIKGVIFLKKWAAGILWPESENYSVSWHEWCPSVAPHTLGWHCFEKTQVEFLSAMVKQALHINRTCMHLHIYIDMWSSPFMYCLIGMSRFLILVLLGVAVLPFYAGRWWQSFEVYTIGPLYCQQIWCMTCESLSQSISYKIIFNIPRNKNAYIKM